MTSSIHSEFDPPKHLSKEQIIDMARRYIKYWRIEAQSFESKWEMELTRKWNLSKETMSNKSEWQPIETAPKDGTWILGFEIDDNESCIVRWSSKEDYIERSKKEGTATRLICARFLAGCFERREHKRHWRYGADEGWIHYEDDSVYLNPTHWMPIPEPPKQ